MEFPQYRFFATNKIIYKILDYKNFEEKQKMGSKVLFFKMEAKQYPEILKIMDMLNCEKEIYKIANENDWLNF